MSELRRTPPAWIDKELIQTSLRIGHADPNLSVTSFTIQPAIPVGDNYASDMFRVSAELDGSNSVSIIFKILPQGMSVELMEESGFFDREVVMFSKVLVKIFQILQEIKSDDHQPFFAKCLHYGLKPHDFMVLEDLTVSGFRNAKRQKGLDLDHCLLVMRNLARFHAASVVLHEREPKFLEMYKKSVFSMNIGGGFESFIKATLKSLTDVMEEKGGFEKYVPKLRKLSETLYQRIVNSTNYEEGRFTVLLHGDLWVNNIMFKYSEEKVVDLKLVDFQICCLSSPSYDLHYFFNTSTNEEVHAQHLDQLLHEYHCTLNNTMSALGFEDKVVSLEDLKDMLEENVIQALYAAISVRPVVTADPEKGKEIQKNFENLVESDSPAPNFNIYDNEHYLNFLKQLLPELERRGCFDDL